MPLGSETFSGDCIHDPYRCDSATMPFQIKPFQNHQSQLNQRSGKKSGRQRRHSANPANPSANPSIGSAATPPDSSQSPSKRTRVGRRSPLGLFFLLLLWSIILGLGLAQAATPFSSPSSPSSLSGTPGARNATTIAQAFEPDPEGLTDPVPPELQLGQALYLENCATCHVALPPAVMPTESWRVILTQPTHYGAQITPPVQPGLQIIWNYVSLYSRPLNQDEPVPYRLRSSRYFRALHPDVEFGDRISVRSCASCHPAAEQFNYRRLSAEWETVP
jgi:mono/diheme cytochrome c family protein